MESSPSPSRTHALEDASGTAPPLARGARLGRYRIGRVLGAGGMGTVYEGVHVDLRKKVAIKVLTRAAAAQPGARERFLREARLTARLRHPNVVALTDIGSEGRTAFLVMELLDGEDLSHRLRRSGPVDARELVDLMLPVCSAMVAAHDLGIVHRDLKPQNIFLARGPRGIEPRVLDFGMSKRSGAEVSPPLTGVGDVVGTPQYLAPEQAEDSRAATPASDQYSVGVIFYKCLTNASPYGGGNVLEILRAVPLAPPVPLRERCPSVDDGLAAVVERAMSPAPADRFPSMRTLARALLPFASDRARALWEGAFDDVDELLAKRDSRRSPPLGPRSSAAREAIEMSVVDASFSTGATVRLTSDTWPANDSASPAAAPRRRSLVAALAVAALAVAIAALALALPRRTAPRGLSAVVAPQAAAPLVPPAAPPAAAPVTPPAPSPKTFIVAAPAVVVSTPSPGLRRPPRAAPPSSSGADATPRHRDALVGDEIFDSPGRQ